VEQGLADTVTTSSNPFQNTNGVKLGKKPVGGASIDLCQVGQFS
jgi:hypothetical protein